MADSRHRASPDELVKVTGPLDAPSMAAAIVKAGVRKMYQPDIERCLVSVVQRSMDPPLFTEAAIPPNWPSQGNIFVMDTQGRRWRIKKDENGYGWPVIKVQQQHEKRTA